MPKPKPSKSHPFRAPWGEPPSQRWEQTQEEIRKRREQMLKKFRQEKPNDSR
jgi:hypothetical protein